MQFSDSYFEDEVRDGFYIPALMKRAWSAHMEVLSDIAAICKKHHIQWFADSGTLLGAVRHKGFIPWDDDIDICMLPEDYIRFNQIIDSELPEGYYIPRNQGNDYRLHTTVWCTKNVCAEEHHLKKFHGFPFVAGVDIFPLYYVAPEPSMAQVHRQLLRIVCNAAARIDEQNQDTSEMQSLVSQAENLLGLCFDKVHSLKEQLFSQLLLLFNRYTPEEAKEVACVSWFLEDFPRKYPVECYSSSILLPFETMEITAPSEYDAILRTQFGDYMTYCRSGSLHDYPCYSAYIKRLSEAAKKEHLSFKFTYRFSSKDLAKPREATLAEDFATLVRSGHKDIFTFIRKNNIDTAKKLLETCQNAAIQIGTALERLEGQWDAVVNHLEKYCELIWQIHETIDSKSAYESQRLNELSGQLDELIDRIDKLAGQPARKRREIVFLPYKASLWSSMEPVWQKVKEDPDCKAFVMPIPYFYKNLDGSFGQIHYEQENFPADVSIADYNAYDFKNGRPDMIFFQSPYDEYNLTVSTHPFFYSRNLKRYTDNLIYIPPLELDASELTDPKASVNLKYYFGMPGPIHADFVLVSSEAMRNACIDYLTAFAGDDTKNLWEEKVICNFQIPFLKTR